MAEIPISSSYLVWFMFILCIFWKILVYVNFFTERHCEAEDDSNKVSEAQRSVLSDVSVSQIFY